MQRRFEDSSVERSKIMKMVSEKIKRNPSPTPVVFPVSKPAPILPSSPSQETRQSQTNLVQMVHDMQKQITHLNKIIANMSQSNDSIVSSALEKKQRELEIQKQKVAKNQKQIEQLIEQNQKRARQIEYLRLEMTKSFSHSSPSELVINLSDHSILGSCVNQSIHKEYLHKTNNQSRVPKKSVEAIMSPLEMSLVKQNLNIEDSKTFCFGQPQ